METYGTKEYLMDWGNFLEKLTCAIRLKGGSNAAEVWRDITLEEAYKILHLNGIKLGFKVIPTSFDTDVFYG